MLINTVPLLEAQASSEIENIVTTNDEVFRAAHGALSQPETPAVKEALRYREALRQGYDSLSERPLSVTTATIVCTSLRGVEARVRDYTGTYIGDPASSRRIYTPPQGAEVIRQHLSAWEAFLHGSHGIDPLVAMALQHYQFEAIHPFPDGNGRTGRVLNLLYLVDKGLLATPVLYLSGYILRHKSRYYHCLQGVTEAGAWEEWIVYMMEAVDATATWALRLIEAISELQAGTEEQVRRLVPRAPAAELTRLLFTQPYIRIEDVVRAGYAKRQAASHWLGALVEGEVLIRERIGRSSIFVNDGLLSLLFTSPPVA
ncbi:Fic family protein [Actinomyces slackii]